MAGFKSESAADFSSEWVADFRRNQHFPPHSGEMATLYGGLDQPGPYLVLMKWYPGYMSAPHTYATDRLSLVLSGTWWVNSGADFDPDNTVPVPAGGFVSRVARTPHYDGVKRDANEPAVIGIFGIAPVQFELVDPGKPAWPAPLDRVGQCNLGLGWVDLSASASVCDSVSGSAARSGASSSPRRVEQISRSAMNAFEENILSKISR